jgi:hypothetical protein
MVDKETITKTFNKVIETKCKPDYISSPTDKEKEFISNFFNDNKDPNNNESMENYITCNGMDDAEKQYDDDYNRLQKNIEETQFTDDEKYAKEEWTGQTYTDMNYYLFHIKNNPKEYEKASKYHDLDQLEKLTNNLITATDKSGRIDKNRHLYRIDSEGLGFTVHEGEVITLKGFQSLTYDKTLMDTNKQQFDEISREMDEPLSAYSKEYYIPSNTKGLLIGGIEQELLIPPNTRIYCFNINKQQRHAQFLILPEQ